MAALKDLYVKRNGAPSAPRGSWAEHVDELNKMSAGVMQQGETAGNGAWGWLKDSADAGFFSSLGGTARLAGEFLPFGNETLNSWADKADEIARRNSPQPGQNLEGLDYVASAVGNALGSGAASALEAGAVAGFGSLLGAGGAAGAAIGAASKVIPGIGKAAQAGKTLWKSPMGKYLVANVAGSPFEAASEAGNLISDMRNENQQGTANYSDEEIRDAAIRSGALNLAWLTGMNMLEAGTLGKITGALGGDMAAKGVKDIAKRTALGGLSSGIGEGAEEYGQNLIGDYSKRGNTSDFNYDEALEAAKMGAIGGGVLGGIGSGLSATFSKKNNNDVSAEVDSEGGTIEDGETTTTQDAGREAFINAIAGQESGGNYDAVNSRTGAAGKYQIMPENWPAWAEEAGLGADAEMTPENQEIVARYKLGEYYDKYGPRGAAMAWYAGEGSLNYSEEALNRKQGNGDEPSINEYADSVLARMGNYADTARIDDSEENYFDESNYTDQSILDATRSTRGFDVSHLNNGEASDAESLRQFDELSPEVKAQREADERRKQFNKLMDELRAAGGPQRAAQYDFEQQNVSSDPLARPFGEESLPGIDTQKPFNNKIQTNLMRKRGRIGNAVSPDVQFEQGQFLPSLMQMARSPREMANVTNFELMNQRSIANKNWGQPQQTAPRYDTQAVDALLAEQQREEDRQKLGLLMGGMRESRAVQQAQEQSTRQSERQSLAEVLGRIAGQKWDAAQQNYSDRKQANIKSLADVINARAAQQWDKAQKDDNVKQTQAQALVNLLNAKAAGQYDAAQQEYVGRAKQQSEFQKRMQALANVVNARAAEKWDEVPNAEKFKFVPQRRSMYDGAMRRNLAAQDRIKPDEQPSVKPTPVNRRALEGRNFVENVIAAGRKDYQNGKRSPVLMAGQRRTPKLSADARMWRRQYQNDKTQREALRDAAISVWQGDPKHPMKECRRLLNLARNMRKEILQPIVDNMIEQGIKQGVEFIPIEDRRMMRESHNAMWYRNYYKENKKAPSQTAMYDIAEDIFLGRGDKYSVGYYSGIDGKGLQQIAKDNHAELDYINNAIEAYETLELKLKENPNYGKEWATGGKAAEETGATKTTRNSEAAEVKAEPTAKSDKDEVNKKAPALAEGYTTESGRSLAEADENEFVLHNGEKNFGEIQESVAEATNGILKSLPIRLQVGNTNFGLKHLLKHESQMQSKGFKDAYAFVDYVLNNFTEIYSQQSEQKPNRFVLYCNDKSKGFMPIDMELKKDTAGYYTIVSAMPHRAKIKGTLIYDGSSRPSTASTNSLLSSDTNIKGGDDAEIVLAKSNVPLSNTSVAQEQENVKKTLLPKGVTAEVKLNDKLNGVEVKFSDKPGPKVAKSMRDAGYTWSSKKQLWYSKQNNAESMAMAEKLGYKPVEKIEEPAKKLEQPQAKEVKENNTQEPTSKQVKPSADIFSKNPDALFNSAAIDKISKGEAPKEITDIIEKMPKDNSEQTKSKKKDSAFNGERAKGTLDKLFGKKKTKAPKANDSIKVVDVFDESKLDDWIKKAKDSLKRLNANPMFDPDLMNALFHVGGIYAQKGINKFADWSRIMVGALGEKVKPYLTAAWKCLGAFKGDNVDSEVMQAVMEYVGSETQKGRSIDEVQKELIDAYGEELKPYIQPAYVGVQNWGSDTSENVVESKQDNTEGGNENGNDGQAVQTGSTGRSGTVRNGISSTGEAVHAGERRSERPDSILGGEPPENGGTTQETGDSSGVRDNQNNQSRRQVREKSELGNVHNGRKGERSDGETDVAGMDGRGNRGDGRGRTGVTTNYHIDDADALIGGTPKVRFLRNKKAIEVVQELMDNDRPATKEERDAMAAYTGWGSFGQELFQGTWENPEYKEGWKEENDWLRDTLGKDAWKEAQNSIINAHYTDPYTINSMWEMAKAMGFKGGKVLEPSMGVGNFFGLMPKDIAEKSQLTGIELDRTTGRMAQALYPQANIQIKGYEESRTPDNFYDMIVGNVPFGNFNIADRRYGKLKPLIHDFFFLKGIDQLKPGGIMMAITSKGTLDKADARVRMELAKKADLVAAYRLPTGAFDKYAGTNVVTDILVFKKLDKPRVGVSGLDWVNSSKYETKFRGKQETFYYNDYFKNHPKNVLGVMEFGTGTTSGRPGLTVRRLDNFGERLKEIANEVPKNIFEASKIKDNIQYISNHQGGEQGSVMVNDKDGELYTVYGDMLKPLTDTRKYFVKSEKQTAEREQEFKEWIKLRDTLGELYDAERNDSPNMEKLRAKLNEVFDDYCSKYVKQGAWKRNGKDDQPPFRTSFANKYMKSIEEPSAARVMALVDDNGKKASIFQKRSVRGSAMDIKNPSVSQALIIQRNENVNNLDVERIAKLAKKTKSEVVEELTKSGTIFKTPAGNYEVKDVYLAGNVRQKLREAEDALQSGDKDMQPNIEALRRVIPATVPYYNISTSMGATWIPQDVYRQFVAHLLGVDSIDKIKLTKTKGYSVELDKSYNRLNAATTVYGLDEIPFSKLLNHAFNHTKPFITKRERGEIVEDTEAMNKANDKLEKIYDEFNDWLWKDNSRKLQLEREYNETMNAIAVPTYDGSFMDMPGMALLRGKSQFNLRQHQLNAIYRGLINGSGVYAHEVGTGKTYTMAGLAVESRRYGLAKKPLLLAFNANSASVAKEINDMYPGAKVLYVDNLDKKNIKLKLNQIRTDDWDCIVMPHSLIDKLSFKEDTLRGMAEQQIYELEQAAIEAAEEDGEKISVEQMEAMRTAGKDEKVAGVRSQTAKKLVTMRNQIINQIKQSALNASAEDAVSFEDLGIDMVLVDEAHAFKKPPFTTTRKIKGLTTASSNRSIQLSFITQYVQSLNDGRGVHLFTGTPITNTLTEMYHMMRYVMPKAMEDAGIKDFDNWMNSFAEETADMEFTSTGDVEMVTRLASFTNVPELRRFVGQYWDTVFADDMPEFKPRETKSGKIISDKLTDAEQDELLNGYTENPQGRPYKKVVVETLKLTNSQNTILNDLIKKAKKYKEATGQQRKQIAKTEFHGTPLLISNDASLAGMDPRLYDVNISTEGEETKIDRCVKNVAAIYKEGTKKHPTVQVIFTDVGYSDTKTRSIPEQTGVGKYHSVKETVPTFNMAKALVKQLTEQGIPENEIVVMKASYKAEKRAQIAEMLKEGKYRVVIGSTATLGVGVNMQDNLRAMHHLDCPWMPGDLTQRNGRGHRQGNHWNTVLEFRYVTEKLDTKRWQTVLRKDAFINSFMKSKVGDNSIRAFEMGADDMNDKDTDSDLLQTLSEASGDPRVLIQKKYETNLAKLERKERTFIAGIENIKGKLLNIDSVIKTKKQEWDNISEDAKTFAANKKAEFEMDLVNSLKPGESRRLIRFDNRTDAQKHLSDLLRQVMNIGVDNHIGEYTGFELVVRKEASSLDGTYQPVIRVNGAESHVCGTPSVNGITSKAANIPGRVSKAQAAYEQAKKDKVELQKAAQEKFPQQEQLDKIKKQLEEVKEDRILSPTPPPEWLTNGVTLNSTFYVDSKPYSLTGYRANSDGYYLVGEANGQQHVFPFQYATDVQGMQVYDMTNHVPSPVYTPPSQADIEEAKKKSQYSLSDEAATRSRAEVEAEIKKALPSAELEQQSDGSYIATMPNGKKLGIFIEDQILLNEQQAAEAGRAHNRTANEAEGYWNSWERLEGKNVDGVLRVSRNSRVGTAFHETLHAAMDLCLTSKEKAALYKSFAKKAQESGRSVDEEIADAYKDWAIKRQQGKGSMFGKLFQKAKDFLNKLYTMFVEAENKGNIFRKLESGKAWKNNGNVTGASERIRASIAQAISSAETSLNQIPAVFNKIPWKPGTVNIDIGGGRFDKATNFVKEKGVENIVFDPFNRDYDHNSRAFERVKQGGDTVTVANVLNVIAESGARDNVILQAARALKEDGTAYFAIYEGSRDGVGKTTTKGWQNNMKAADYVPEVKKYFAEVRKAGNVIIAKKPILSAEEKAVWSMDDTFTHTVKYSVAPGKNKIASAFTNTERKGAIQSAKDFIKEQKKNWYSEIVDKNHILKSFDALTKATGGLSIYDSVQNLPSTTAGMVKAICEGNALSIKAANQHLKNVKMKHNVTLAMALDQINKDAMDKAQPKYLAANGFDSWINAFGAYLGAERLLEMNDLAKAEGKVYKFPKGLTEAELKAFTRNVPPQFRKAADIFYKVNDNMISVMEDAQVFSPELAKALRTKYKKYCPLLRDFSDTAAADTFINGLTEGGRGIGNVSIPLKKINIEGSERGVMNPLESVLKSYAVMLNRAERNKVGLMAVNAAKTAQLHDLIKEMPEKKDVKGNVVNAVADPKNCIFTVLVNGKKKAYQTTQELYAPIVGYNLPAAGLCINVARMAAHMLRTGATMSPSFIVRNLLRDTVFAGISSKNGFIPIVDSIRGAMALWNDPAMRAEFEAAGVTEFNFYGSQASRIKSLDKMVGEQPVSLWEMIKWAANRLEAASDFVESSTRMGEYMKARKNGLSMEEAARAAREVTLDFSRSGVVGEQINRYVPFFNACIQGGDKMVRLLKEDPWGTSQKLFQYIVLPSFFLWAMNHDEDWYKDLDPDVKNNYWCLGEYIRIPKPQEAGVLFGSGIEALLDQANGKDKDAMWNMAKAFTSNMVPGIVPTLFLPLLEWQANYSYFKGRALVGSKYQRLPDELQYNDYTSELSKAIGNNPLVKVSPMKIDNLIRGYTGTMGALLWSAPDAVIGDSKNLPEKHLSERVFFRDFALTDANKSRPMNNFYDILDKANRQHAGYGVKGKPAEAVKGIRSAGNMISKIRKDVDKITHSNLMPERKRELIDKRKEKMNQIAKKATERYSKYFE